jgi:hypothetical protein
MTTSPKTLDYRTELARAEQAIAATQQQVIRQQKRADKLAASGRAAAEEAQRLLALLQQALGLMRQYRALLLQVIAVEAARR